MSKEFNRIILPIDGSDHAKEAAKKAFTIAKNRNIDVIAIHIIHSTNILVSSKMLYTIEKMMIENAKSYLYDIEKIGRKMKLNITTKIIRGTPYNEIINFAKYNDLIVMGNKGKSALDRILIGSVAEKVIRHAPCDVLIVKTELLLHKNTT
jgi:nucleotide-binding universal stress UspA family protein